MSIRVAHPHHLGRLNCEDFWLYADEDLREYARVEKHYGEDKKLLNAAALQAAISHNNKDFLSWVDTVLKDHLPRDWIAAAYFKDVSCTPVFLHLCCLQAALSATKTGKNVIVVTRNAALATQIVASGGRRTSSIFTWWNSALTEHAKAWAHWILWPWQILLRSLIAKLQFGRSYPKCLRNIQILLDTFFFPEDLGSEGVYKVRVWPGVSTWYKERQIRAATIAYTGHLPLSRLRAAYKSMLHGNELFVLGEYFLRFSDCLQGAWESLKAFFAPPPRLTKTRFNGIECATIAIYWWRISTLKTVISQIWINIPKRMQQQGVQPEFLLDWYENQPLDKSLFLGFRKDCPNTIVVAGRQFLPTSGIVNFFTTAGEVTAGAAPRFNWVCGKHIADLFKYHDPIGNYQITPALRYSYLFKIQDTSGVKNKLIIFLTSIEEESLGILECAFLSSVKTRLNFDSILIKIHQTFDNRFQKRAEIYWPAIGEQNVIWDSRPASVMLQEAALVLTGSSSVALEAVCQGVPVILSGRPAGISFNVLEGIDSQLWRLVYNWHEFEWCVHDWLPYIPNQASRLKAGREIRDTYFEKMTPETMLAFDPARIKTPAPKIN